MPELIKGDPRDYRVGEPGTNACVPFSMVLHGSHLPTALGIVRDGVVRRGPVRDLSHFTDTGLRIAWVGAFDWGTGSRHGCVHFGFDWKDVLHKKNVYWAEVVKYSYPACRFLITDVKYAEHPILRPYDPRKKDGPWWYDAASGTHYQNKDACVEFMIEEDLPLYDSVATQFLDHSDRYCCVDRTSPRDCPEFRVPGPIGGSRFLGQLVAARLSGARLRLTQEKDGQMVLTDYLRHAWNVIHNQIWKAKGTFQGAISPAHPAAQAVARGILSAIGSRDGEERTALTTLFGGKEEAVAACASLLQTTLRLPVALPLEAEE